MLGCLQDGFFVCFQVYSVVSWPYGSCHLGAPKTPASSMKVETSGQKVCVHVRVMILLLPKLPTAAAWSCSVLGPCRSCPGQGTARHSSKFHLQINFYPTAKSLLIPLHHEI